MGTFIGHFFNGSAFVFFSIWWIVNVFSSYYQSLHARKGETGKSYRNSVTQPCTCCPRRCGCNMPVEGILKIAVNIVGIIGEIAGGMEDGKFVHKGNAQHATIMFFFAISGMTDMLLHYGIEIIPKLDYMAMALAFIIDGLLFAFHLHGKGMIEVRLHVLLIVAIFGCVASTFVEMRFPKHPGASLARCFFVLVQGTWLCHIGFQLFPPASWLYVKWDDDNHDDVLMTTVFFTWHLVSDLFLILGIGLLLKFIHNGHSLREETTMKSLISRNENDHTRVKLLDSEKEEEFDLTPYQRLDDDAVKKNPPWVKP